MKDTIEFPDFEKLDLRVGKVIAAAAPEWSHSLLEFRVDFGPEIGEKNILSSIKQWYQPAEFIDNNYAFIINLAERKMGEGVSQGMMLMADPEDKPTPFTIPSEIAPGTVVR